MWMSVDRRDLTRALPENVGIYSTATPVSVRRDSQGKTVREVSDKNKGK